MSGGPGTHSGEKVGETVREGVGETRAAPTYLGIRLLTADEIDPQLLEVGIKSRYLPTGSYWSCLKCLLVPSNELFNSWSSLFASMICMILLMSADTSDVILLPYAVCLKTFIACTLASFAAHTWAVVSPFSHHVLFSFDHAGLQLYSFGSSLLFQAYCRGTVTSEERSVLDRLFMPVATVLTVLGTSVGVCSLNCDQRHRATVKLVKIGLLVLGYLWSHAIRAGQVQQHATEVMFTSVAFLFYITRWPERRYPGRFDLVGHSHNWFHVLGQIATASQLAGARAMIRQRPTPAPLADDLVWWSTTGFRWVAVAVLAALAVETALAYITLSRSGKRYSHDKSGTTVGVTRQNGRSLDYTYRKPIIDILFNKITALGGQYGRKSFSAGLYKLFELGKVRVRQAYLGTQ